MVPARDRKLCSHCRMPMERIEPPPVTADARLPGSARGPRHAWWVCSRCDRGTSGAPLTDESAG